ncbi:hypothetical protein VNI00_005049 [Paramarasmius palmivorus]|uniref:Mediator of RNA polymerase II transcription subunit 19 n=1 Tax=Paramarasmius palmivorus TaxID=297713 RepID=A0AAW0DLA0_9AGAR
MQTNAVAGPSHSNSPLFLLPPPQPHSHSDYIKSTNDLLGQFYLKDAYDKYVRPPPPTDPTSPTSFDKGKGKEVASNPAADANDADEDEAVGKGEKKKKNTYKHLIKGIPGKHSMKKDDYLTTAIQVPPKQRVKIAPFDFRTQQEAFTVTLEGIKGWNTNALVMESAQVREDRKKRKELKRLARAQMQAQGGQVQPQAQSQPTPSASTPRQAGPYTPSSTTAAAAPTPSSAVPRTSTPLPQKPLPTTTPRPNPHVHPQPPGTAVQSSSTPAPSIPRPSSTTSANVAVPGGRSHIPSPVQIPGPGARAGTPLRTATPTSATAPHPLSAPPLSANSIGTPSGVVSGTGVASVANQQPPRGKKREHDDSVPIPGQSSYGLPAPQQSQPSSVNGSYGATNGVSQHQQPPVQQPGKPIIGARAGNNGVRPRPIKKQRMDAQGVARDATAPPVQQPTPQGV